MDQRFAYLWVSLAAAITITAMWTGWIGLLMVAILGGLLTVGLRTGSFAPMYPDITRAERPVWFWLIMSFAAFVVAANLIRILMRL
jgi:hypothetical protein